MNVNVLQDCFNITLNKICPCNPEAKLEYDHVTESDFEDDMQETIVEQYYSYTDSGRPRMGSGDQVFDEETAMNDLNGYDPSHHNTKKFFGRSSVLFEQ